LRGLPPLAPLRREVSYFCSTLEQVLRRGGRVLSRGQPDRQL